MVWHESDAPFSPPPMARRLRLLQGLWAAEPSRPPWGPLKVFLGSVFFQFPKASAVKRRVSQVEAKAKLLHGASRGPVWLCCQAGRVALSLVRVVPALPPGGPAATPRPEPGESASIPALPPPTRREGGSENTLGTGPEVTQRGESPSQLAPSPPGARALSAARPKSSSPSPAAPLRVNGVASCSPSVPKEMRVLLAALSSGGSS